jgi:hypothetical protein
LIGGFSGILYLWPQVSVEPTTSLAPTNPLATRFNITNQSGLPIYQVWYNYQIWEGDKRERATNPITGSVWFGFYLPGIIPKLASHAAYSVDIESPEIRFVKYSKPMLQLFVTYSPMPFGWPEKQTGKRFYALPDANGQFQWYFAGEAEFFGPDKVPNAPP